MCTLPSWFVGCIWSWANNIAAGRRYENYMQVPRKMSISLRFPQCIYLNLWLLLILKFRGFVRRSILFASWFGSCTVIPKKYCLCLSGIICTMPCRFSDAFDLQHAVVEGTLEVSKLYDCPAQVVINTFLWLFDSLIGSTFSGFLSRFVFAIRNFVWLCSVIPKKYCLCLSGIIYTLLFRFVNTSL